LLGSYIYVKYKTNEGPKTCCFWCNRYFDTKEWTTKILEEANRVRMPEIHVEGIEAGPRDLILVDSSHMRYVGERAVEVFLDVVDRSRRDIGLEEPVVLRGKPKDRLIEGNKALLPRARLIALLASGRSSWRRRLS
jgi:hypothetical protein